MDPAIIAAHLREIAIYLFLDGDHHRARAYRRAAQTIESAADVPRLIAEQRLDDLPNVGRAIAAVVDDLARRGTTGVADKLRAKWPAVIVELSRLPGVGVTKARLLHAALAPANLDSVAAMCRSGAVRQLRGFGATSEAKILAAIEGRRLHGTRAVHVAAEEQARSLALHLAGEPAAQRVEIAGAVRRWIEAIDCLVLAVSTDHPAAIAARLAAYPLVTSVDEGHPIRARLADGMPCEVHCGVPARFGWTWIEATGSREHVAGLAARGDVTRIEAPDEAAIYAALGLPFVPPELRDGTDELSGEDFDDLITFEDITTAFHCHTTYSDGKDSIEAMARAAGALGMRAITITDHSAAALYAGGIDAAGLRRQAEEIAALPDLGVRVLRGTEADILVDGAIDVPAELLDQLDVVIASVHQRFKLDEDGMTRRVVTAMRQPFFKVWGHALGRLVLRREPIAVRIDEVLDAIAESPAAIEINGDPHRLDLDPHNARRAAARGIPFVLSSDAHSTRGLEAVRSAVAMARRARIRKRQVLNALPPEELAARVRPIHP
jgi:DNA polymerase (family X)